MIGWQVKAVLAAVVLGALGGLLWHDHHETKRANSAVARAAQAEANLSAERENTRKANEAAQRHQQRADALEADRRDNPLPAVRVCRSPARVREAGATGVAHEATEANDARADAGDSDAGEIGADIGPALDDFATDAQANLIQCEELQRWVRER